MRDNNYIIRPIEITYDTDLFEDTSNVRDFVRVMRQMPKTMQVVEHGNPYATFKMTDLTDGSSFNVWALPPRTVSIIPGLKATPDALERLTTFIFQSFSEGEMNG